MKIKHKAFLVTLTGVLILMSGCTDKSKSHDEQSAAGSSSNSNVSLAASSSATSSAFSQSSELNEDNVFKTTPAQLPEEWTEEDDLAAINIAINDAAYQNSLSNIGAMLEDDVTVGSVMCLNDNCLDVRFSTNATNFYYVLSFDELDKMNEEAVIVRNAVSKRDSNPHIEEQEGNRHYKTSEVFEPFPEHLSEDEAEKIAFTDAGLDTSKAMSKQLEGSVGVSADSWLATTYYEIKFSTKDNKFKYKIDAVTGEITEKNVEPAQ